MLASESGRDVVLGGGIVGGGGIDGGGGLLPVARLGEERRPEPERTTGASLLGTDGTSVVSDGALTAVISAGTSLDDASAAVAALLELDSTGTNSCSGSGGSGGGPSLLATVVAASSRGGASRVGVSSCGDVGGLSFDDAGVAVGAAAGVWRGETTMFAAVGNHSTVATGDELSSRAVSVRAASGATLSLPDATSLVAAKLSANCEAKSAAFSDGAAASMSRWQGMRENRARTTIETTHLCWPLRLIRATTPTASTQHHNTPPEIDHCACSRATRRRTILMTRTQKHRFNPHNTKTVEPSFATLPYHLTLL